MNHYEGGPVSHCGVLMNHEYNVWRTDSRKKILSVSADGAEIEYDMSSLFSCPKCRIWEEKCLYVIGFEHYTMEENNE